MSRIRLSHCLAATIGVSSLVIPTLAPVQAHVSQDLPPHARPGECYGRVVTAPTYATVDRQVLEREAWTETKQGPPVVEKITRRVLVTPARTEQVRTAAVYEDVVRWETRPGKSRTVTEPARYRTVTEKVLVQPERSEWRLTSAPLAYGERRIGGPPQTMLQATGEVYCRVLMPAVYEHVERKVRISAARTYTVPGQPRKVKIVDKVLVRPAGTTTRTIPARYRTEVVRTVTKPGPVRIIPHPAVYRTVKHTELVRPPGEGWAQVVCAGPLNPQFVVQLQHALIAKGYDPGAPDGVASPATYAALRAYQRDRGMAQGQLTVESAVSLGVL